MLGSYGIDLSANVRVAEAPTVTIFAALDQVLRQRNLTCVCVLSFQYHTLFMCKLAGACMCGSCFSPKLLCSYTMDLKPVCEMQLHQDQCHQLSDVCIGYC